MNETFDAARLTLLLSELRLPATKQIWASFARAVGQGRLAGGPVSKPSSYFPAQNSALLALCREPKLTRLVHRRTGPPGCVSDPLLLGSDPLDSLILLVYLNHVYG